MVLILSTLITVKNQLRPPTQLFGLTDTFKPS